MKRKESKSRAGTRYLLTALVALAFAMMLAVPAAFAETGKITINSEQSVTYNGYQIFTADVASDGKASNIQWANDTIKNLVIGVIQTNAGTYAAEDSEVVAGTKDEGDQKYTSTNAQDALEYINGVWGTSGAGYIVDNADFANKIADAVQNANPALTVDKVVTPKQAAEGLNEGWWLFVTTPSTLDANSEMGTSVIFTQINKDQDVTTSEKTTVPTVKKHVKNDKVYDFELNTAGKYYELTDGTYTLVAPADLEAGTITDTNYVTIDTDDDTVADAYARYNKVEKTVDWAKNADGNINQDLSFKLEGTVASNVKTFDTYFYEFEDTMTGLEPKGGNVSTVVVEIDGEDVTSQITGTAGSITYSNGSLKVTMNNLKGFVDSHGDPITINENSKIVVTYEAHLTANAVIGQAGNPNVVHINYSRNPNTNDKGRTEDDKVKVYAYQIEMYKVDKGTQTALPGAKFTIVDQDGKYVQANGSLGAAEHKFETGADGKIAVSGLDEGIYTITETDAPEGYTVWATPITLEISANLGSGADDYNAITASLTGGPGDEGTAITNVDSASAKVSFTATNDKRITMPLTGMDGITFTYILGGLILAVSVFALLRRKMVNNNVQEDVA